MWGEPDLAAGIYSSRLRGDGLFSELVYIYSYKVVQTSLL